MATAKERAALSRARRQAFLMLGKSIEQLDMPDTTRTPLRVAFVATAIACRAREVLTQLLALDPSYRETLEQVFNIMEADAVAHPDDFLATLIAMDPNDNGGKHTDD